MGGSSSTAAVAFGGQGPTANTELWNGSNWTEVNNLNTGRFNLGSCGTETAALCFGGEPGTVANTETWNGTNWTEDL